MRLNSTVASIKDASLHGAKFSMRIILMYFPEFPRDAFYWEISVFLLPWIKCAICKEKFRCVIVPHGEWFTQKDALLTGR